jgi:hypothetical protein
MFSKDFHIEVKDIDEFEAFSEALTTAISGNTNLHQIQYTDILEKWGVTNNNFEICYGRHLYYHNSQSGEIPFWIGLAGKVSAMHIVASINRLIIDGLGKMNSFASLNETYAKTFSGCSKNGKKSESIVIIMQTSQESSFDKSHSPTLLKGFMGDITKLF